MPKRRNGEGTFDKVEKNGVLYYRWRGTFGYVPETGKPNRKELYARTQKELRQKVEDLQSSFKAGTMDTPKRITVAQWMNQWVSECCSDVKTRTRIGYECIIRNHINPKLGMFRLVDLQPVQVQSFINGITDVTPKTIKNIHGVLHSAMEKALEWRYIAYNPVNGCSLPRIEKHEVNFLAGDDLKAFLAACDEDEEYGSMMKLAVFTGMREGEIIGLHWASVDFKRETIMVKEQMQLIHGNYYMVSTKSDKIRVISPAPFVFDLLRQVQASQSEWRFKMGTDWVDDGFVFTRYNGMHKARNTLIKHFKRTLAAAGLPTTTRFHDLRHSYAVFALECGDNIKQVQNALGHYSAAFTLSVYEHISDDARKASQQRQQAAIRDLLG